MVVWRYLYVCDVNSLPESKGKVLNLDLSDYLVLLKRFKENPTICQSPPDKRGSSWFYVNKI